MTQIKQKELVLNFDNSYVALPAQFYQAVCPEPVTQPRLEKINHVLAQDLGFMADEYEPNYLANVFSGNQHLAGSQIIAQAYAGHQFGGLSPQLGDGRAMLLGEVLTESGERLDVQLKGSGRTAFSRGGDGKATLYSVLREYLIAEAMHALGIPTTRSLAVVATGENIVRYGKEVPAAVLTRVASSHIRVGTFQYFAIRGEFDAVKTLADYSIARHYPEVVEAENPYLALLASVMDKQIHLVTQWMRVGFIHGVMNTDNVTISGETIDYGPCAFMDNYDPATKFSSIDTHGRYAFANQGMISYWNMARFAESLSSIVAVDPDESLELLTQILETYPQKFQDQLLNVMRKKLGLLKEHADDRVLVNDFLDILNQDEMDYTLGFRGLNQAISNDLRMDDLEVMVRDRERFKGWKQSYIQRLMQEESTKSERLAVMDQANPIYIPRNWHVEEALINASERDDYSQFNELHDVLKTPYAQQDGFAKYASTPMPMPSTSAYKTYCGT